MRQRPRIYYSSEQRNLMWDRWQKGESLLASATLLVIVDDYFASRPDIGFIRLTPLICMALSVIRQSALAVTYIEENN